MERRLGVENLQLPITEPQLLPRILIRPLRESSVYKAEKVVSVQASTFVLTPKRGVYASRLPAVYSAFGLNLRRFPMMIYIVDALSELGCVSPAVHDYWRRFAKTITENRKRMDKAYMIESYLEDLGIDMPKTLFRKLDRIQKLEDLP